MLYTMNVKTIKLKVDATKEVESRLTKMLLVHNNIGREIINFLILCSGNDNIRKTKFDEFGNSYDEFCNLKLDQFNLYDRLTEIHDEVTLEDFQKTLNDIYDLVLNSKSFSNVSSTIFNKNKKVNFDETKKGDLSRKCLMNARDWGVLPLISVDDDIVTCGTLKGILSECQSRILSWNECNLSTKETYSEKKSEYQSILDDSMTKDADVTTAMIQFMDDVSNVYGSNNENQLKWFNNRFLTYVRNKIRPFLLTNSPIDNFEQSDTSYNCSIEIVRILSKYEILWKDEVSVNRYKKTCDDGINIEKYRYLVHAKSDFLRYKETASFKEIHAVKSPISLCFGNNYQPFSLSDVGDRHNINFGYKFGKLGKQRKECSFNLNYRRKKVKYANTPVRSDENKCYLDNLEIEDAKNGSYKLSYMVNKKYKRESFIKEPKMKMYNGKLYMYFPMSNEFEEDRDSFALLTYFSRSSNSKSQIDEASNILQNRKIRVCGVDLGINPTFALSVLEYSDNKITDTNIGMKHEGSYNNFSEIRKQINDVTDMISYLKSKYDNCEKDYSSKIDDHIKSRLNEEISNFCDLVSYKRNKNTIIRKEIKNVEKEINKIKNCRRHTLKKDLTENFGWVSALNEFISLKHSFNDMGESFDSKTNPSYSYFEKWKRYIDNIKDDSVKTVSREILNFCIENSVDFIALEDLQTFAPSDDRTKSHNKLTQLWCFGKLKKCLEDIASMYGIHVYSSTDPRNTSDTHFESKNFGYRDESNKHNLWVNVDGEYTVVDSDINASKNIANRFLTHHKDLKQLPMIGDGTLFKIDSSSKRNKSFAVKLNIHKNVYELIDGEFVKSNKKPNGTSRKQTAYIHGDMFIDSISHKNKKMFLRENLIRNGFISK